MNIRIISVTAIAACLWSAGAFAGDPESASLEFAGLTTESEASLGDARGGDNTMTVVTSSQDMSAGVHGASFTAGSVNNGTITIGDHGFDGFSGVGVNVLNTGNANAFSTGINMSVTLQ